MGKTKKEYVKPLIKKVKLFSEEAVLAGCKLNSTDPAGKNGKRCGNSACRTTFAS